MIYHLDFIDMQNFSDLDRDELSRFLKLHDIDIDDLLIEDIDIDVALDEITVKHFLKTHDGRAAYFGTGPVRDTFSEPLMFELPGCLSKFSRHLRWVAPSVSSPAHAEPVKTVVYTVRDIVVPQSESPVTITVVIEGEPKWAVEDESVATVSSVGASGTKAVLSFGEVGRTRVTVTAGGVVVRAAVVVE